MRFTQDELGAFKEQLRAEKSKIERELQELKKGLDFGDDVDHFEEEADEAEEFANRLGVKATLGKRLTHIDEALEKIQQGMYGRCESCGSDIESEILKILPESKLCKGCKQQ